MITNDIPVLTGNVLLDLHLLRGWLIDLQRRLEEQLDTGWSVSGVTEEKLVSPGMTVDDLANVVGTLVGVLMRKGYLGGQ